MFLAGVATALIDPFDDGDDVASSVPPGATETTEATDRFDDTTTTTLSTTTSASATVSTRAGAASTTATTAPASAPGASPEATPTTEAAVPTTQLGAGRADDEDIPRGASAGSGEEAEELAFTGGDGSMTLGAVLLAALALGSLRLARRARP